MVMTKGTHFGVGRFIILDDRVLGSKCPTLSHLFSPALREPDHEVKRTYHSRMNGSCCGQYVVDGGNKAEDDGDE